jgi:iron complex transport system permease protein
MRIRTRAGLWSAGLLGLLAASVVVSATIGPVRIAPDAVARAALNGLAFPVGVDLSVAGGGPSPAPTVDVSYVHPFAFDVADSTATIVRSLRLPRIALAAVVGFALATAGVVMQGFFRNPMADPSIIGVSSGAAVGAVASIALPLAVPFGLRTAAFTTALVTAFGVYLLASERGRTPVATLLLAGIAVQAFLGAAISFLLLHAGESLEQAIYWLMGNLHNSAWGDVAATLPLAVGAFLVLLAYASDLNAMLLGEADARAVGVAVERTRRILLAVSTVVTAAAVAVAGVIGFVGLIVPHIMRLVVGPDHRVLLPASAFAGATFLVLTDTVARAGAAELPVGVVTAALGAPFFLYLLRDREVHAL